MPLQESHRAADRGNRGAGLMGADLELRTWRSRIAAQAAPEVVLETLTDVSACRAWSPVGFTVDGLDGLPLRRGATPRVSGNLGGRRVHFQVEVLQADAERLRLYATGPVEMVVAYAVQAASPGSSVEAVVSVRAAPGWIGTVSERLTRLLLAGGALNHALARMAREAERRDVQHRARRRSRPAAAPRAMAETAPAR
jgi:Polyketide cyclase / dehydrase and lipid transport